MSTWSQALQSEKKKAYFQSILSKLNRAIAEGKVVYPPKKHIFEAFKLTELSQIKVVILGQDPYHQPNQAHGLAFSVPKGISPPPSLKNIYRELARSNLGFLPPQHGCLEDWTRQGVFLLNNTLTVEAGKPASHRSFGWETFTDRVIQLINEKRENVVFMLWGAHAQQKKRFLSKEKHLILEATHPSPLSAHRGFLGCNHFVLCNQYLIQHFKPPIDWRLT